MFIHFVSLPKNKVNHWKPGVCRMKLVGYRNDSFLNSTLHKIIIFPCPSLTMGKSVMFRAYFRFYGRISKAANTHDPETLATIRKHGDGLGGISGERIWLELKKILTGRHTASIIRVMVECGLAPHMGMLDTI